MIFKKKLLLNLILGFFSFQSIIDADELFLFRNTILEALITPLKWYPFCYNFCKHELFLYKNCNTVDS